MANPTNRAGNSRLQATHKSAAIETRSLQTTEQRLDAALQRIAELENRLRQLESVLSIDGEGAVKISSPGKLCLSAATELRLEVPGQTVQLDCISLRIASNSLRIAANRMAVNSADVKFEAAQVDCSGAVKCDTIIANSVVGSNYASGAGNIW